MEALQYIYTSWKNGDSTEKGYMIYSRSEGISESECTAIKDAMQYLAPKELTLTPTPQEIADIFPYAFSYFVLPTGRGCVAQSTYLGKDYSGRYGNYIIHALIFDINDLPCRPAEFFAEPYIKTAMTQEELDAPSPVPPLPPLHISEYASVINDEQLNEFLFDKEDEFAQLISMILVSQDAGIPFYLNDSRENLVLWAAAVQRILPSRLAKKFMFNTYIGDHESMRSPRAREEGLNFHLIGVRPDANYFNYATECESNRQIVMDFIGGHMTQGVPPNSYAHAMAASIAFDCDGGWVFGIAIALFVVAMIVAIIVYGGAFIGGFHSLKNYILAFKHNVVDSNRKVDLNAYGASSKDFDDILNIMLINLEKMFGLKDKDTLKRNLAVVINKVDIPTLEEKIGETAAQQYLAENAKTCKSYMDARDAVCRNFLEEYGAGNFVRTAEAKFKTVRYFTCSALGHNHEGQPYEGKNVVDPVMWLLQQADSSIKAE